MEDMILNLTQEAFKVTALLSLPFLLTSLFLGLGMGFLQALTQIQESSLNFVPKLVVVAVVIVLLSPWMFQILFDFTKQAFALIPHLKGAGL